ncbi:unnamed protein product, partial [Amoebophrya sp. A120]|eukprot:GSA120T00020737001.1
MSEACSSLPQAEDFPKFIHDDKHRSFGLRDVVPSYMDSLIAFLKTSSCESLEYKSKRVAALLMRIVEETEGEEIEIHEKLADHLKKVYEGKRFAYLRRLLSLAVDEAGGAYKARKAQIMGIIQKLTLGFRQDAVLPASGFWMPLPSDKIKESAKVMQLQKELNQGTSETCCPTRNHWATDAEIVELHKQMLKQVGLGRWRVVPNDTKLPMGASLAFPVKQPTEDDPNRARCCIDFRSQNRSIVPVERMRLNGARCTMAIIQRCMSSRRNDPVRFQSKKDLLADMDEERRLRAIIENNNLHQNKSQRIFAQPDDNSDRLYFQSSDNKEDEEGSEPEDGFCFRPYGAKRDLRSFYYQCGTREEIKNAVFFPVPQTEPEKPETPRKRGRNGKPVRPRHAWALILSAVQLFGSLSSVYECVSVSETLQIICCCLLRVLVSIYIDDLHILSRKRQLASDEVLVDLMLALGGWWQSSEKGATQLDATQRALTVLGM